MESKKTIFDYLGQTFTIFGVTILILNIFCMMFGQSAAEYSTMFALGNAGLTVSTTFQFLLMSAIITVLRYVFFTDGLIEKLSLTMRIICMFVLVFVTIVVFVVLFDWFPMNLWQAWVGFFASFVISVTISTLLTLVKERMENKKLEEALLRIKNERKGMPKD